MKLIGRALGYVYIAGDVLELTYLAQVIITMKMKGHGVTSLPCVYTGG